MDHEFGDYLNQEEGGFILKITSQRNFLMSYTFTNCMTILIYFPGEFKDE